MARKEVTCAIDGRRRFSRSIGRPLDLGSELVGCKGKSLMTATLPALAETDFLLKVREILDSVSICLLCTHGEAGRI